MKESREKCQCEHRIHFIAITPVPDYYPLLSHINTGTPMTLWLKKKKEKKVQCILPLDTQKKSQTYVNWGGKSVIVATTQCTEHKWKINSVKPVDSLKYTTVRICLDFASSVRTLNVHVGRAALCSTTPTTQSGAPRPGAPVLREHARNAESRAHSRTTGSGPAVLQNPRCSGCTVR